MHNYFKKICYTFYIYFYPPQIQQNKEKYNSSVEKNILEKQIELLSVSQFLKKNQGPANSISSDIKQNNEKNQFLDESIVHEINNPPKIEFKQIGINNEGNTCYMNSALQFFFHYYLLTSQIFENQQPKIENEIAIEYKNTLKRYLGQKLRAISITSLIHTFKYSQKMKKVLIYLVEAFFNII